MIIRATFNSEGFPTGFYPENVWPTNYPSDTVEITEDQYRNFTENQGLRKYVNGRVVQYSPPSPSPTPIITYKGDVWRRVTEEQANQLDTEISKLGVRERNLWSDSLHLDHSDPFFLMLRDAMIQQWGITETDRVLAASEG